MHIIRNGTYDLAVQEVMQEQIVIDMVNDLKEMKPDITIEELEGFEFTQKANLEYHNRGGNSAKYIGTVPEAIRKLIKGEDIND
jgi:hypothetical protein